MATDEWVMGRRKVLTCHFCTAQALGVGCHRREESPSRQGLGGTTGGDDEVPLFSHDSVANIRISDASRANVHAHMRVLRRTRRIKFAALGMLDDECVAASVAAAASRSPSSLRITSFPSNTCATITISTLSILC